MKNKEDLVFGNLIKEAVTGEVKQEILAIIKEVESLTPKELEADLPPIDGFPDVPNWHKYEHAIWGLGEKVRQLLFKHKALRKDKDIIKKILQISLDPNSKRGRQSFILLLGNINCKPFANQLITQINDKSVDGQVIDSIYKMKASGYSEIISPYCHNKKTWIRNIAKKYIEKFGN